MRMATPFASLAPLPTTKGVFVSSTTAPAGAWLVRDPDNRRAHSLPGSEQKLIGQIEHTLELLQGKWKVQLVFLMARGVHRHCRLLASLRGASKKMMTDTLRALERDGLVIRRIYDEMPLRVEYSLTPLGWAITEPLISLAEWDDTYGADIEEARLHHRVGAARAKRAKERIDQ